MIRKFDKRPFWFPRKWANSIVDWLLGVKSPRGTISIRNTADPDADGSLEIDVNVDRIAMLIEKRINRKTYTVEDRKAIRDIIRSYLDGNAIVWKDGLATVNTSWLEEQIKNYLPDASDSEGTMGTPVDNTSIGTLVTPDVRLTGVTNWTSGGANGVRLQVFVAGLDDSGLTALFPAYLDITNKGTIQSITFQTTTAFEGY